MFNYCVEIEALKACFRSYNDDDDAKMVSRNENIKVEARLTNCIWT